MTPKGRWAAVQSELALADEELRAAESLAGSAARIALGRVYFAAFHLARAMLFHLDLEPRSHAGVRHLFNVHWVATGKLEPRFNALLSRLQKYREEADYALTFPVDETWVRSELAEVRQFRDLAIAAVSSS